MVLLRGMSVLFEEQIESMVEYAADAIIPVSVFEEMVIHHEGFDISDMKEVIEGAGGMVHGEGHHA